MPEVSPSSPVRFAPSGRARRPFAAAAVVIGAAALIACVASEWNGIAAWTRVHGNKPHQDFALFARGELRLGTRGTAGSFTRALPAAGVRIEPPSRMLLNPPERVWMAWWYTRPQTGVFILPVAPIAATALGVGFARMVVRPRGPRDCPACGYDLAGLPDGRCPECGAVSDKQEDAR